MRVTVGASVDGQDITVSNRRRLIRHRELGCPSVTLKDPSYNTASSSASWSVEVERRLLETDPGIAITFDDGVSFSELPDDCAATQSVVTCHVASFDNSNETFKATQTIGQTCNSMQHTITADARFADDNAIVPVSPSAGLNIDIPALNPCVTPTPHSCLHTDSLTHAVTDTYGNQHANAYLHPPLPRRHRHPRPPTPRHLHQLIRRPLRLQPLTHLQPPRLTHLRIHRLLQPRPLTRLHSLQLPRRRSHPLLHLHQRPHRLTH